MQLLRIDWNVIFTIVNLIVLYLGLRKFLIGPVTKVMDQRKQLIEGQMADARHVNEQANELKAQYEDALKHVLFQSGVELLQVVLCQLIQRDVTQFRDDMQVDPVFISCTGGSPEFRLGVVLIPEVYPISEGHFGLDFVRLGWSVLFL